MSNDNYATHIVQKYRLALSIAIIKTKPEGVTLEDHIQNLINKFNPKMEQDFMNISIDSDDFVLDEDDNFMTNMVEINDKVHIYKTQNDRNEEVNIQSELNNVEMTDTQNLNDSIGILQNFEMGNEYLNEANTETTQRKSLDEVMDILKGIDEGMECLEKVVNPSNLVQYDDLVTEIPEQVDDTQYFKDIEPPVSENFKHEDGQITNQGTMLLINNQETGSNCNNMQLSASNAKDYNKEETKPKHHTKQNTEYDNKLNNIDLRKQSNIRSYRHTKEFKYIYQNIANVFGTKDLNLKNDGIVPMSDGVLILDNGQQTVRESQKIANVNDVPKIQKSQAAMTHNITQDLTCNTHYSQSQNANIVTLDNKYIHSNKRNNNSCKDELKTSKKKRDDIKGFNENVDTVVDSKSHSRDTSSSKLLPKLVELPNVLISTNRSQTFDKSNENRQTIVENLEQKCPRTKQDIDNLNTIRVNPDTSNINNSVNKLSACNDTMNAKAKIPINEENVNKTNNYRAVGNIETDLFLEESQMTYFTTFSTNAFQPKHSQDGFGHPNRTNNYRNIDDNKKETSISTDLENQIRTAQFRTPDFNSQRAQSTFDERRDDNDTLKKNAEVRDPETCADFKIYNSTALTENKNDTKINDPHQDIAPTESCANFDEDLDAEEVTDAEEVVPFKIIEEINKVKMYLSKRDDKNLSGREYSNDTGYRSDWSSMKTSQSSTAWVDQSAHSLLNYITDCPLVDNTEEITNEISVILGHLIDKLNEEEKCPAFLEDMLASIQTMLRLIYEDDSGENALTKKDEYIHRSLLFNKSIHLQKYTIEKITQKLENVHSELTTNDLELETKNIHQIENTCYIFHLLEILLKKYSTTSQHLSQSNQNLTQETQYLSQNSQEDNLLKKSGIMDIWRKKWNPNFKETQNEGSQVKKECVISKCCVVLNKLIVECMEKYSLVSYCALKCFNLVQT